MPKIPNDKPWHRPFWQFAACLDDMNAFCQKLNRARDGDLVPVSAVELHMVRKGLVALCADGMWRPVGDV